MTGRRITASSIVVPGVGQPETRATVQQGAAHLEQVAHDQEIRELGDRSVRIAIDGDDRAGRLHPDLVLDRAADPKRQVELGLDDLARLPDLLAVTDPARVDRGACCPDDAIELVGEPDETEPVRPADSTPPATMIFALRRAQPGLDPLEHPHGGDRPAARVEWRRPVDPPARL
jgi:hypothetical protein